MALDEAPARATLCTVFRNLFSAALLACALGAQSPSTDVSVGVFPFLIGNMDGRIGEIVTNCQTRGIDTLYVSVFRATGPRTGDLWITDRAGTWNPGFGAVRRNGTGIDLVNLINACHAANIRVVGILKCFHDNVQPSDALHRQYLLDVVSYLVDSFLPDGRPVYDLDGIALDYVRYVGSGNADASIVTNFVADVRQRIRHLSLHAYLVASRFTFDGGTYDGNFQGYATVINSLASQYGQHWEQFARHCDVLMPMAYTANGSIYNTYALHQAYVRQTALYARTACQIAGFPTRRVVPTIRTYTDSSETTTDQTVEASITGALLGGGNGYQAFRYQHLVDNPSWWTKMAQYAVPGCNWPVPVPGFSTSTLTTVADASSSRDHDQQGATLQVRYDFDGDGVLDTPWQPNTPTWRLNRHPGTWTMWLQVRDAQGQVSTTRRRHTTGTALALQPALLAASGRGSATIQVDVGSAGAGATYLLLASLSGTSPGFLWRPGFPVPLNVDFLTDAFASDPNGNFLQGGLGLLDNQGSATATITVPPPLLSAFAGSTLHWTVLVADSFGRPLCVGEARAMAILP